MKPLDEEQLTAIASIADEVIKAKTQVTLDKFKARLAKLSPKPKFPDEQVVVYQPENAREVLYYCYGFNEEELKYCRPLTLTELGPDVKALRDAAHGAVVLGSEKSRTYHKKLKEALKAFDAKHGSEE